MAGVRSAYLTTIDATTTRSAKWITRLASQQGVCHHNSERISRRRDPPDSLSARGAGGATLGNRSFLGVLGEARNGPVRGLTFGGRPLAPDRLGGCRGALRNGGGSRWAEAARG